MHLVNLRSQKLSLAGARTPVPILVPVWVFYLPNSRQERGVAPIKGLTGSALDGRSVSCVGCNSSFLSRLPARVLRLSVTSDSDTCHEESVNTMAQVRTANAGVFPQRRVLARFSVIEPSASPTEGYGESINPQWDSAGAPPRPSGFQLSLEKRKWGPAGSGRR